MNNIFIAGLQKPNLRNRVLIVTLSLFFSISLFGQEVDELVRSEPYRLEKQWFDKNGRNILEIDISALCIPEKTIPMGF